MPQLSQKARKYLRLLRRNGSCQESAVKRAEVNERELIAWRKDEYFSSLEEGGRVIASGKSEDDRVAMAIEYFRENKERVLSARLAGLEFSVFEAKIKSPKHRDLWRRVAREVQVALQDSLMAKGMQGNTAAFTAWTKSVELADKEERVAAEGIGDRWMARLKKDKAKEASADQDAN